LTESGQVFSINCSPGGVPKLPVPEALITTHGLFGDSQANGVYHQNVTEALSRLEPGLCAGAQGRNGPNRGLGEPYRVRHGRQGMAGVAPILAINRGPGFEYRFKAVPGLMS
jgi:hypothetical protein